MIKTNHMKFFTNFLLALLFVLPSRLLHGAFETFSDSDARSRAMGNATAALPVSGGSILMNPAMLAHFPRALATLTAQGRGWGLELEETTLLNGSLHGVLPLGQSSGLGVGYQGSFNFIDSETYFGETQISAGYGLRLGKIFSAGAAVFMQTWSLRGAEGILPDDFKTPFTINATLGLHARLSKFFSLGLVGANLIGMNLSSQAGNEDTVPRIIRLASTLTTHWFVASAQGDFLIDTTSLNLRIGGETQLFKNKILHVGVGVEVLGFGEAVVPSVGLGITLTRFSFDYAFSIPIPLGGAGNHTLSVSLIL